MPRAPLIFSSSLWIKTSAGNSIQPLLISVLEIAFVLVLLELSLERPQPDAEEVRGLGAVPPGAAERLQDGLALDIRHRARLARDRLDRGPGGGQSSGLAHLHGQV